MFIDYNDPCFGQNGDIQLFDYHLRNAHFIHLLKGSIRYNPDIAQIGPGTPYLHI